MVGNTLHERMAQLALDLRSQASAKETLQHVVEAVCELLDGCDTAAISLATRNGRIETAACTSLLGVRADQLQQELAEGPCMDAAWRERTVSSPDLEADERWPRWGPAAVQELGLRSLVCVQLFTHEDRLGGLNLFSTAAQAFTPEDIVEAQAVAAHAAVALQAAEKIEQLSGALASRTVTAQAVGLVMERYAVSSHQAFAMLRRVSNEHNAKLRDLAEEMVLEHDDRAAR